MIKVVRIGFKNLKIPETARDKFAKDWCKDIKSSKNKKTSNPKFYWRDNIRTKTTENRDAYIDDIFEDTEYIYKTEGAFHCLYCEKQDSLYDFEIDHLKPKIKYCDLAYKNENLFLACSKCNKKKNALDNKFWEDFLKKVYNDNYEFYKYFFVEENGDVIPHPALQDDIKELIKEFISKFDLKRHKNNRKRQIEEWASMKFDRKDNIIELLKNRHYPDYLFPFTNIKNIKI